MLPGPPGEKWTSLVTPSVLALWSAGAVPPQLLAHDEHFVYLIHSVQHGPLILRLTPPKHRTYEQVAAEVEWIAHLANNGVRVARAVPAVNGALVSRVSIPGQGTMHAVAFDKAAGRPIDMNDPSVWNDALFERWGALMGRMHALSATFSPRVHRPELTYEGVIALARRVLPSTSPLPDRLERAFASFRDLPRDAAHYGLVHGDLHHGNLYVDDAGRLTVFDFDRSYLTWFLFDVAAALDIVLRHRAAPRDTFLDALLRGYTREHPLTQPATAVLPAMLDFVNVLHDDELRTQVKRQETRSLEGGDVR